MRCCLFAGCLLVLTAGGAIAAEPSFERTDLFEPGRGGYPLYRIPGIVITAKGTLLAYCEARRSDKSDWAPPTSSFVAAPMAAKPGRPRRKCPASKGRLRRIRLPPSRNSARTARCFTTTPSPSRINLAVHFLIPRRI